MADSDSNDGLVRMLADYPEVREALVRKLNAEALRAEHESKVREYESVAARIVTDSGLRDEQDALASDRYHHSYQFVSAVNDNSVANCIDRLMRWDRQEPECPMEIIFNSPGGSVIAGMALFDFIAALSLRGGGSHQITTLGLGYAASMAGILLQAGDKRRMGKQAWVLIHEISFSAIGKIGEVEDTTEWAKRICKRVVDIFAERSHMKKSYIEAHWKRKDWWISSEECLKLGIVDEVV